NGALVNQVVRYTATTDTSGNIIADTSKGEELILDGISGGQGFHNAGHMKFDKGSLYITTGDNFYIPPDPKNPAQDLTSLNGKMLRIIPLANAGYNGLLYSITSPYPFATRCDSVF